MSWGIDATKITSQKAPPVSKITFGTIPTFFKWLVVSLAVVTLLLAVAGLVLLNRNCPPSSSIGSTRTL